MMRSIVVLAIVAMAVSVSGLLVDTNKDGVADLELLDSTGSGSFDTIINLSQELTGMQARAKLIDLNQDGQADLKLIDTDADGIHDSIIALEVEAEAEVDAEAEAEVEADLEEEPVKSNFSVKPVILDAPASASDPNAPVFHPYGSLGSKKRRSNNHTVVVDPTAPAPSRTNKCGCPRKLKEYVGAEIYPDPAAPAKRRCGCRKAKAAEPAHLAPEFYPKRNRGGKKRCNKTAAAAPIQYVAPIEKPDLVAAAKPAAPAAAPAPPTHVAPAYYP